MVRNICKAYKLAEYCDIQAGNFYTEAYSFAVELANKYAVDVEKVAGIIAVLSPGTAWDVNKRDAAAFLAGKRTGFSTYSQFIQKAVQILHAENNDQIFDIVFGKQGQKTASFYLNILLDQQAVTVDRHAYRIAVGDTGAGGIRLTRDQYNRIAAAYVDASNKLRVPAPKLQAITWNVFKRINDRGRYAETKTTPF